LSLSAWAQVPFTSSNAKKIQGLNVSSALRTTCDDNEVLTWVAANNRFECASAAGATGATGPTGAAGATGVTGATGPSGGGSGASYPTDLLCSLTVSTTTATFGSGASGTNPCNFQGSRITAQGTLTITSTPAAGTYYFETAGGVIYANLPGATTGLSASGVTMSASTTGFTVGRAKIATITYTSGANWDATVTDWRQPFSEAPVPAAGTLMTSSDSSGVRTLNVDAQNLYANNYCRSTTGNDTYTCGTTPATVAYSTGRCYVLNADTANTGAATVNIDSLGAKSILRRNGDALQDGDITANKPIGICYDGTQLIIQGDGGGSATVLSGNYWTYPLFKNWPNSYNVLGTTPRAWHDVAPFSAPVTKVAFAISGAAALPGANADGIVVGVYEAGCATQIVTGPAYTGSGTAGLVTFSSTWNMVKDTVYCFIIGTDSTTVQVASPDQNGTIIGNMLNSGTTRAGTCANPIEGGGTSLELPNTADGGCGTISTASIVPFHLTFLP